MPPIDVLASLRKLGAKVSVDTRNGKGAISVSVPVVIFDPDQKRINREMAKIIADECRDALLEGRRPDGAGQMPGVSAPTQKRRELLEAQGNRSGQAAPQYVDSEFRSEVADNWASHADEYENFQAKRPERLSGTYRPKANGPRGVVSGLLANSFLARPKASGMGFVVFVAAARAAALARVLQGLPAWGPMAQAAPRVRARVKRMAGKMVIRSAGRLGASVMEFLQNLERLAEASSDLADE